MMINSPEEGEHEEDVYLGDDDVLEHVVERPVPQLVRQHRKDLCGTIQWTFRTLVGNLGQVMGQLQY